MLRLRVKAPFAAFRPLSAGSYRPTAPFLTPSAAYGLVLNVAAIESRRDDGVSPMTVTATGLPPVRVAIGALQVPEVQTLYQQLHNYPVGATGRDRSADAKGNKYNIQPIRREFLSRLDAYICLDGNDDLETRVREGLRLGSTYTPEGRPRYGVPFLGDNNFLISVLREERDPVPAHWFVRLGHDGSAPTGQVARLSTWIDRRDMSRTIALLFHRLTDAAAEVPEDAWTMLPPKAVQ